MVAIKKPEVKLGQLDERITYQSFAPSRLTRFCAFLKLGKAPATVCQSPLEGMGVGRGVGLGAGRGVGLAVLLMRLPITATLSSQLSALNLLGDKNVMLMTLPLAGFQSSSLLREMISHVTPGHQPLEKLSMVFRPNVN